MEESDGLLIKGIKSGKGSIKILKLADNNFIVEHKKYLITICYFKEIFTFCSIDCAEDKFLELKFKTKKKKFSLA